MSHFVYSVSYTHLHLWEMLNLMFSITVRNPSNYNLKFISFSNFQKVWCYLCREKYTIRPPFAVFHLSSFRWKVQLSKDNSHAAFSENFQVAWHRERDLVSGVKKRQFRILTQPLCDLGPPHLDLSESHFHSLLRGY